MVSERSFALEQRSDHAPRRAAGAQDQHALVPEVDSEISLEVA